MLSTRIDQIVNRRQEAESGISRHIDKATKWKNYVEGLLSIYSRALKTLHMRACASITCNE